MTGAALAAATALAALPVRATPERMAAAVRSIVGDREPKVGRVTLTIPSVAETGNSVPVTVSVASSMAGGDRVKAIHLVDDGNPAPEIASYRLGSAAGKAELSTRIRLFESQMVLALAELEDGSVWSASAQVTVAFGACADG